jgi:UDP-N-acetylglucosamine 2-epimerase (non-hydrolysing)
MKKVITVIGTRPEIIRTSRILPKLDKYANHIIIHTNQNFVANLKDIFFQELELRQPDIVLNDGMAGGWNSPSHTTFGLGSQLARMFPQIEEIITQEHPDCFFILGDTNSALCAIIAERMGIPVYHMEAGNRSYDIKIPEEVNRHLIDSISTYNLTYTQTSKEALLREGGNSKKIFLCGNPTLEVLTYYKDKIDSSTILEKTGILFPEWGYTPYFLADFHRTENVNSPERLGEIIKGLNYLNDTYGNPVYCSIHPKTKDKLKDLNIILNPEVHFLDAFGFFDFVKLEQHARVVLTDSGLVSEEACLNKVPCVIIRDTTERPEVVEVGGAIISGLNAQRILECTNTIINSKRDWKIPEGFDDLNVSDKVINFILGEKQ